MQMDSILYAALLVIVQVWDNHDPIIGTIIDADRRQYKRNNFHIHFCRLRGTYRRRSAVLYPVEKCTQYSKNTHIRIRVCPLGCFLYHSKRTVRFSPVSHILRSRRQSFLIGLAFGGCNGRQHTADGFITAIIYDNNNNIVGVRVFIAALLMGVLGFIAFQFMIKNTVIRVQEPVKLHEKQPKLMCSKALTTPHT